MAQAPKKTKIKPVGFIKMQVAAGQANAGAVGPALGQRGLNIMDFCNRFNNETKDKDAGSPIPVVISYFKDKSFTFKVSGAPVSYYILKAINIKKGGSKPGQEEIATIKYADVLKIAETKIVDMNANDIEGAAKMVAGSARSMGIRVIEEGKN